jgi:hypothetical protein
MVAASRTTHARDHAFVAAVRNFMGVSDLQLYDDVRQWCADEPPGHC